MRDQVRVACVCDIREPIAQAAADQFPGARAYTDITQMLQREKPAALIVLTSEAFNAPTATLALQAGIPVYLEKPPALTHSEWKQLMETEDSCRVPVYTAFNRRHTPLFQGWTPPAAVKKVRGALIRLNRAAPNFPYTAIHLIDAAQYFSQSQFREARVSLDDAPGGVQWSVRGKLENGADCALDIIPNGSDHAEYLTFETAAEKWTLYFPNKEGTVYPLGRLIAPSTAVMDQREGCAEEAPAESMGYAPCFRDFLNLLQSGAWANSPHRLIHYGITLRLLEEMMEPSLSPSAV